MKPLFISGDASPGRFYDRGQISAIKREILARQGKKFHSCVRCCRCRREERGKTTMLATAAIVWGDPIKVGVLFRFLSGESSRSGESSGCGLFSISCRLMIPNFPSNTRSLFNNAMGLGGVGWGDVSGARSRRGLRSSADIRNTQTKKKKKLR